MELKDKLLELLRKELRTALGCTEPAAVALAAAYARRAVGGEVQEVLVKADPNVYKNGMGVYVPNGNDYGLDVAAALGAISGDPELKLEVLKSVTPDAIDKMKIMRKEERITVTPFGEPGFLNIIAEVKTDKGIGVAEIAGSHTNLVSLKANGTVLVDKPVNRTKKKVACEVFEHSLRELMECAEIFTVNQMQFLKEGALINLTAAEAGLEHKLGLAVGARLLDLIEKGLLGDDIANRAMVYTAAAADARMQGWCTPIMSTGGSGNQGITASLPVYVVAKIKNIDEEKMLRALAISQTVTLYVKQHIGKLSAICACAIAASLGSSCGITYLLGGTFEQAENSIMNMAANLTGEICDGAKLGCSVKLATAACTAVQTALLSQTGMCVPCTDGIVADTAEETIRNIGRVSNPGMVETDKVILEVMLEKQCACRASSD